jgi:hypothetical protein
MNYFPLIILFTLLSFFNLVGMGHHGGGHRDHQEQRSSSFQPTNLTTLFGAGHHGGGHRREVVVPNNPPLSSSIGQNTVIVMPRPSPSVVTIFPPPPPPIETYHHYGPWHYHRPPPPPIVHVCNTPTSPAPHHQTSALYHQEQQPQEDHSKKCCHDCCNKKMPPLICLLIASFCAVFFVTSVGTRQERFILNPGESRRVLSPNSIFYKSLSIEYSPFDKSNNDIQVKTFFYPQQDCPPLTGPIVTLYTKNDLNLAFGDYEYDYFYLNTGSHIAVSMESFASTRGSANILLLRGQASFDAWCNNNDFVARPLLKRQAAAGVVGAVLEYTVQEADSYYVVVENPNYWTQFIGTEAVMVQATSFDVSDKFQVVPSSTGVATVNLNTKNNNNCIIVQVTSAATSDVAGYDETIMVKNHRRWTVLFICVGIVDLILMLCCAGICSKSDIVEPTTYGTTSDIRYTPVPQQPPPPAFNPDIPIVEATLVHEQQEPSAPPLETLEKS